jgi:hypothetical protein
MPARTKARAKFDFGGRPFVWWIENEKYLRICSLDKKFIIACWLGTAPDAPEVVEITGPEFPGLSASEGRPLYVVAPPRKGASMGAWVHALLTWSFQRDRVLERVNLPPPFL